MLSKNDISLCKKDISLSGDDISLSGNDILQYVNDISLTGSDISPKNKTIAVTIYRSIYRLRLISIKYRRYVAIFVDYRLHYFCTILYALICMLHNWYGDTDGNSSTVRMVLFDFRKEFDLIDHAILWLSLRIMSLQLECWTGLQIFLLTGSNE